MSSCWIKAILRNDVNRIKMLRNLRGVVVLNVCFSCGVLKHSHLHWSTDTGLNSRFFRRAFTFRCFFLLMVLHLSVDPMQRGKRVLNDMNQPVMLLKRALTLLDDSEITAQSIRPWLINIKSWNGMWFVKAYVNLFQNSHPFYFDEHMKSCWLCIQHQKHISMGLTFNFLARRVFVQNTVATTRKRKINMLHTGRK